MNADEDEVEYIPLKDACKLFPRPGRKPTSIATVYRWSFSGVRGVVLKTAQVGGTRCTSRMWIAEFVRELTAQRNGLPHQERWRAGPAHFRRKAATARAVAAIFDQNGKPPVKAA